jgi:hypothetical protein
MIMKSYADLELHLQPQDGSLYRLGLRYRLTNGKDDDVLNYFSDSVALDRAFIEGLRERALSSEEAGRWIYNHIFGSRSREALQQFLNASQVRNVGVRLRFVIAPELRELHTLPWERLLQPGLEHLLGIGERLLFSRYLFDDRPRGHIPRPRRVGRAHMLVVIASPSDLNRYSDHLAPIDAIGELDRLKEMVGNEVEISALLPQSGATIERLLLEIRPTRLRPDPPDVVYLLAHGGVLPVSDTVGQRLSTPILYLEQSDGTADVVPASTIAQRIGELEPLPRLVVVGACTGAGDGYIDMLHSLGPQLVAAGIPAVIAMQGYASATLLAQFLPVLFREVFLDGCIDRAMSVARAIVRGSHDEWWLPVLFLGRSNGMLWNYTDVEERRGLVHWLRRRCKLPAPTCQPIADAILACRVVQGLLWDDFADLDDFVDWIAEEEPDSVALQHLLRTLDQVLQQRIPHEAVRRLHAFLREVRLFPDEMLGLFYRCAPISWKAPSVDDEKGVIIRLTRLLATAEIDEITHSHPLLTFLDLLLERYSSTPTLAPVATSLRAWFNEIAGFVGFATTLANVSPSSPIAAKLQIVVRPRQAVIVDQRYFLHGWFHYIGSDQEERSRALGDNSATYKLEEFPRIFRNIIDEGGRLLGKDLVDSTNDEGEQPIDEDILEMHIEVFLSRELLLHDFDKWEIAFGEFQTMAAGKRYWLTVRSLERTLPAFQTIYGRPWKRKWAHYQQVRDAPAAESLIWSDDQEAIQKKHLFSRLLAERTVALGQTWLPEPISPENQELVRLIDGVLATGIPICVFVRPCRQESTAIRSILESKVRFQPLCELPRILYEERQFATSEDDVGEHLTVLWDDPASMPPTRLYPSKDDRSHV